MLSVHVLVTSSFASNGYLSDFDDFSFLFLFHCRYEIGAQRGIRTLPKAL